MANNTEIKRVPMSFSALDKVYEVQSISPIEKDITGYKFVQWGEKDLYAPFLYDCFMQSSTLQTCVNSLVNYVVGNHVHIDDIIFNDEKAEKLIGAIATQYAIYGGFALNILRNKIGGIADIVVVDMKCIRSDKKNETFFYSESFGKKSYGRQKYIEYPKYDANDKTQFSSILYYKDSMFTTYPIPCWSASSKACQVEGKIGEYHIGNLINGFSPNTLICLNNGVPSADVQAQFEEEFTEKFTGSENAGRVIISYANDKDHSPNIETFDTTDFAEKYNSLTTWAQREILKSFRMNKNLAGLETENNGFSSEEYADVFKIYNRTTVRPIQKKIANTFDTIFQRQGTTTFVPFSLEDEEEKIVK